jgi:hypothetical protein
VSGDSTGTGGPNQAFVIMTEAKTPPEPVILIVEDEELCGCTRPISLRSTDFSPER